MKCAGAALSIMLLLTCGCVPHADNLSEQERVDALSVEVVRLGRAGVPGNVCGPPTTIGPKTLVFATADTCLSCLEAGALLRELTRQGVPRQDRAVITPAGHAREVCEYLRREKVQWRVVGITGEHLPTNRIPRGIVYFELEADGQIRRREYAESPLELAEIIIPAPVAAAALHSQQGVTQ